MVCGLQSANYSNGNSGGDSGEGLADEFGDEAVANLVEAVQELLPRMSQACLERAKERILALGEEVTDAACAEQEVQGITTAAASRCPDVDEAGVAAFAEWAGHLSRLWRELNSEQPTYGLMN